VILRNPKASRNTKTAEIVTIGGAAVAGEVAGVAGDRAETGGVVVEVDSRETVVAVVVAVMMTGVRRGRRLSHQPG